MVGCRRLEHEAAEVRAAGRGRSRRAVRPWIQAAMVLDVHWTVAGLRGTDQQVGLAYAPAGQIGWQASADDELCARRHPRERRLLPLRPQFLAIAEQDRGARMTQAERGDDPRLEFPSPSEPALHRCRRRQRLTRPDRVPLRADRTLFGYITALRRRGGHIVAS